ncbi:hypothetical protein SERLA73DRAFT_69185 [Serpula lacrymans var. lacrymans S7.3]|uniref:Uncharacterized protein n=2 Tax=Serpula lacrymans var. lacrymans TaxID=341189 RepID=F8PK48_SERL3|nr:uncharacterized protein SERLADRAFT_433079 [Serpula lacrymans var. lacrymans S7.9]EGO03288.1 hypothetical protein SERLA73DRAFT_69185 [Serpula lacrymans var. lacrymans S7.3]EGO29067.1 hypothetical protein SERLADRAFT_433079 [Serpula lacrymans var. lacrymans S7.9]
MSSLSLTSDYVMRGHHGSNENHNLYANYVLLHAHLQFDQNHGPGRAQSIISCSGTAHIRFFPQTESFPIPTDEDINGPPSHDMNGQVNVTVEVIQESDLEPIHNHINGLINDDSSTDSESPPPYLCQQLPSNISDSPPSPSSTNATIASSLSPDNCTLMHHNRTLMHTICNDSQEDEREIDSSSPLQLSLSTTIGAEHQPSINISSDITPYL